MLDIMEAQNGGNASDAFKKFMTRTEDTARMGFNALQRNLRSREVPPAMRKFAKDIKNLYKFADAHSKWLEDNGRNPTKEELFKLMRENGLGNTKNDLHRVTLYMDSGLVDRGVLDALTDMHKSQSSREAFSFDEAMNTHVTFDDTPGNRDTNLKAIMAYRQYIYRVATDTNLETGVGDTQVLQANSIHGRFFMRLTSYASLAYRMFRNLAFAAPASVAATYLAGYYILENLYASLSRIARGTHWKDELDRWTAFNERPVETVATYITAGINLPQFFGTTAQMASAMTNAAINIFGFDTPSFVPAPAGASTIGVATGIDMFKGMFSLAHSAFTGEEINPKDVSRTLAATSPLGVGSVLARLLYSAAQAEQRGLQGQNNSSSGLHSQNERVFKSLNSLYQQPPALDPVEQRNTTDALRSKDLVERVREAPVVKPEVLPGNRSLFDLAPSQAPDSLFDR